MYNANNYGYNPYGNYVPQRPIQQEPFNTVQRCSVLNGKQVESVDVVKGIDIPLDGSISYFPIADGQTIVTKQLQMDGTSKTLIYKLTKDDKTQTPKYITADELNKEIGKIDLSDIDDIKEEIKEIKRSLKEIKKKSD